ncbi:MAG TPA: Crp/Fnr family transcriptional regulator [Deltaproteobacteria bacterium]|nr:Crp/Fnr family transcriptional regulator [Deltaproteobacteria bacterium]
MDDILNVLSRSQLFGGLSDEHLKEIGNVSIEKRADKGEIIFFDGEEGNGFYLVVEGVVRVYKMSLEGKEQILHIVKAGETVGAVPVFSGKSFPANAQAITESLLLFFPKEKFISLITGNPSLTMNILAILSMRLREFTVQIENLSLKELPGRLAAYLLYQSQVQGGGDHITLDISKSQISNILGTRPESLSRVLGAIRERRLIEVDGPNIRLLDRNGLEDLEAWGKI